MVNETHFIVSTADDEQRDNFIMLFDSKGVRPSTEEEFKTSPLKCVLETDEVPSHLELVCIS
jgi:hypothetical protein